MIKRFMVNYHSIVFKTCLLSFIILLAAVLPACGSSSNKVILDSVTPLNLNMLSLVNIWDSVAESAGLPDSPAHLDLLMLNADKNGNIITFGFNFNAVAPNGRPAVYYVGGGGGRLSYYSEECKSLGDTRSPLEVFSEIDKVGLDSLKPGDGGISMNVNFVGGDIGYSSDHVDIYQVKDGQLLPLKDILFHSSLMWCTIGIMMNSGLQTTISDNNAITVETQTTVTLGASPAGNRNSQIWFLSEDVNQAETVVYLGTPSVSP